MTRRADRSTAEDAEALARTDPLLRYLAPRGAEEEFARLFGMRAAGLAEDWGRLSGWTLSRRLWKVADESAGAVRPYASEVARGSPRGSLEALSRLPVELLRRMEEPALGTLRARLDGFLAEGTAVIGWPQLWRAWWEGGGGDAPWRVGPVLEALGVGMEPDPRLGRGSSAVALFALGEGSPPGPGAPHRASRPVFAVAAPVLAAVGLAVPPLPLWITLVALSGIPPGEIPRMDAHLAYRVATGIRPGPVRGPLGELARDRRRRLGRALVEAVAHPGTEPGEGVLAALVRAYGLLGLPPLLLRRDLDRLLGSDGPHEDQASEKNDGHRKRTRGRGRVPVQVREAFDQWIDGGCRGRDLPVGGLGWSRPLHSVLRSLADCPEVLSPGRCRGLGIPEGSTYARAAREVHTKIRVVEEVDAAMAPLYAAWNAYEPAEPLANLGWPVLIGGRLYRVDDEVLIGMEGQPDLPWDDLDPSEALPPPEDVIAAERDGSP